MQQLRKQLRIRQLALPTLKSKESVLRLAIQKQKGELAILEAELAKKQALLFTDVKLWAEFPHGVFSLKRIEASTRKIAGVLIPQLSQIIWENREFSKFNKPIWIATGVSMLKEIATIIASKDLAQKGLEILEQARKKTTQKVNLYEKVQIPEYGTAILKVKRYLEDVENLEKAAQKLTKQRQVQEAAL